MSVSDISLSFGVAGAVILVAFLFYGLRVVRVLKRYKELQEARTFWLPLIVGGAVLLVSSISELITLLLGFSADVVLVVLQTMLFVGSGILLYGIIKSAYFWIGFATERSKMERMMKELESEERKSLEDLR